MVPRAMLCAAACGIALFGIDAQAQPTGPSFAGKTITLKVGYPPGANATIGRVVAEHIGRHIPGHPQVIMQTVPGAATFQLGNYMYSIAPKDGTELGYISQTAGTEEMLGNPAVRFKTARFNWIGRVSHYNIVTTTWHTTKVKTVADALKYETTAGADSVGSTVYNYPFLMNKLIGTRFKMVLGYPGTAATALAMERGEVDGISTGWFAIKTARKNWLAEGKINILFQALGERHPDLPNVPTMIELTKSDADREFLKMYAYEGELGKSILAPPDVPPEIVRTFRAAFDVMVKDPKFIADAEKMQVELAPLSGEKIQALIAEVAKTPPEIVARAKAMFR